MFSSAFICFFVSKIIALLSVIVILSSGAEAQRQRGRGQYGRRREVAPVEEIEEAQPQPVYAVLEKTTERPKIYEIHREIAPNLGDGTFKYYSATSDGLESEQVGHFNNPYQSQIHQGFYTTKDEHGQVVKVDYIADKSKLILLIIHTSFIVQPVSVFFLV